MSISQPWIRSIVRWKVKAPVEFGAKLDVSIDGEGYSRLEKVSFDVYNESGYLIEAVWNDIRLVQEAIRNGYWQIRSTVREGTGLTAKDMGYGSPIQNWGDRRRMLKQIRNRNTKITPTGSKWNGTSAGANAAMA